MSESPGRRVHFLGICGTAMGAVAAAMKRQGWFVSGSDNQAYPPMTDFLASRGIEVFSGFRPENLPTEDALIVVGNAISRGNPEVEAVLNRKLNYASLPEVLRAHFLHGRHNIVVSGTHGKTTTTSITAWILEYAGLNPSYLIGGLPANLGQGACLRDAATSRHFVIEGDEYDTAFFDKRSKFLHYLPELVVVNNIEFDHADIFKDLDEIKLSFRRLLNVVPTEGMVLINGDDQNCIDVSQNCQAPIVEVGFSENAANRILHPWQKDGNCGFELFGEKFQLPMIGEHNLRNAAMAVSAAHFYGVPTKSIREALLKFEGIKRRQEVRGVVSGITIIDDFGHHPTAIRQTLEGLSQRDAGSRIWALFEPRSNTTRRAVFQHDLPPAFAASHGVVIGAVNRAADLKPEDRLDADRLVADLIKAGKSAFQEPSADKIVEMLRPQLQKGDVIVVLSNGAFDGLHEKLLLGLQNLV
ncbi:MAG: UDP-N-acetylmuramate:L-alanyl-gamma-D-glutamyl-meso-diaminopimelate ligase [Verrucomicrobia bacterium]|nr:UDP-N-acetylmuramate:L-alanyl-gamma-D-glutamyl-meso-diaminopimelate ligase [Verrucomicrobiota bacterium]